MTIPTSRAASLRIRHRLLALTALGGIACAPMIACSGEQGGDGEHAGAASSRLTTGVEPQALLNEIEVNPPSSDQPNEYVEIKCAPSAVLSNVYFVSMEGDSGSTSDPHGTADLVVSLDGVTCGTNGLVVIKSINGGHASDPATTVVTNAAFDAGFDGGAPDASTAAGPGLENGTNTFLLIESATAIVQGTPYDTADAGSLALPSGATILDSVAWTDNGANDRMYGPELGTGTIDGATRFPNDETQNSAAAWYGGNLTGGSDTTTYSASNRSAGFPSDGALTPGAINVGTPVADAGADGSVDGAAADGASGDGGIIVIGDGSTGSDASADDGSTASDGSVDLDGATDGSVDLDAASDGSIDDGGASDGSADDGSTDGGTVTAPVGLVISQVYGGGGNSGATYLRDFVEIFNRGQSTLSTSGLALMYGGGSNDFGSLNADGGAPDTLALPALSVAPGTYVLVGLNAGTSAAGIALPTVDVDGNVALGAANGKVALVVGTAPLGCGGAARCGVNARVVDMVGYGTGTDFEGTGATPTLSATKSAQRKGQGCVDTDDNNADFTAATPAPRNSATSAVDCTALPVDAGGSDSGTITDGGNSDAGHDAGTNHDAGTGGNDAGTTTDAGTGGNDSGITPPADASAPTGGDSGASTHRPDSGADASGDQGDDTSDSSGCSCRVGGAGGNSGTDAMALAGLFALAGGLVVRRKRRD